MCRFLNSETGGKVPGRSLLDVGVQVALQGAGFDEDGFIERGGIFDWTAPRLEQPGANFDW
jgi:radical S-adenosyl methionine domain-containing protein 2